MQWVKRGLLSLAFFLLFSLSTGTGAKVFSPDQILKWTGKEGKRYVMIVVFSNKSEEPELIKKIITEKYVFLFYYMPYHEA
jgi:hypothetical protein